MRVSAADGPDPDPEEIDRRVAPDPVRASRSGSSPEPEPGSGATAEAAEAELEWWEYPGLPFSSRPEKLDYLCMFGIMVAALYSFALMPFRVWLLTNVPYVLLGLTGSSPALVGIGARIDLGEFWWPIAVPLAALSLIKFDWLFWLAGRRWGEGMIDWLTGGGLGNNSGMMARWRTKIAWWSHRLAQKWALPMLLLTYIPFLPIPSPIIFGALGMGGMRLRTFLLLDFLCAFLNRSLYLYLGYRIGEPVLPVLETLDRWALWIALGTAAVIMVFAFRRASKAQPPGSNTA